MTQVQSKLEGLIIFPLAHITNYCFACMMKMVGMDVEEGGEEKKGLPSVEEESGWFGC